MERELSEKEKLELVKREAVGICERCGEPGVWMNEPYDSDLHGEQNPVCYCEECAWQSSRNV